MDEGFQDTEDLDGLFSGYDPETRTYDTSSWGYAGAEVQASGGLREEGATKGEQSGHGGHGARLARRAGTGARRDARASALRVPAPQAALLPVHARDGVPDLRLHARAARRGRRGAVRQLGPRAHVRDRVLRRLDAAHGRRPVHPHRGHPPAPARERRPAGRRDHGAPWARVDPGLDRHPHALQHPPGLHPDAACPDRREPARLPRVEHGAGGLLGAPRRLPRLAAARVVGRARDRGERLLLRPPPAPDRRPLGLPGGARDARREDEGLRPLRREPGRRLVELAAAPARARASSTGSSSATSTRSSRPRSGTRAPRSRRASSGPRSAAPRSSSSPRRPTSRRTAPSRTRSASCSGTRRPSSPPATAAPTSGSPTTSGRRIRERLAGSTESEGPAGAAAPLGAADRRPVRGAECSGGSARDQRRRRRGSCARVVHRAAGRRLDGVRLLDLLRCLRRRREPRGPSHAALGAGPGAARVGVVVALEPSHPLQPRLGRPGRQAVVGAEALRLVGRGAATLDRARRPGLRGGQAARLRPAGGREGRGRDPRRPPVRAPGRRQRLAVRPVRAHGRAVPDALRAARVAGRERALRAALEPGAAALPAAGEPLRARAGAPGERRVPVRGHDASPDRAPHRRRDVADVGLPLRAAAGAPLRGLARSSHGSAGSSTAAGRRSSPRARRSRPA